MQLREIKIGALVGLIAAGCTFLVAGRHQHVQTGTMLALGGKLQLTEQVSKRD